MKYIFSTISRMQCGYIVLMLFSVMNMMFMHYYIFYNHYMEDILLAYDYVNNFLMIIFDVVVILLVFVFFLWGRVKQSLLLTFIITWMWSFLNIFYARFFNQYIPLSVLGQISQLTDQAVYNSIISGFQWIDLYYPISFLLFLIFYRFLGTLMLTRRLLHSLLIVPVVTFLGVFIVYSLYHFSKSIRGNIVLYKKTMAGLFYLGARNAYPNSTRFTAGCVRVAIGECYDMFTEMKLTELQQRAISLEVADLSLRVTNHHQTPPIKNVIMVILESFLSAPIDLKVDGKEITPFLNVLKQRDETYYNGHMIPNITMGESGDGQFIYMTGILPLRDKLVVGEAKSLRLPALPHLLASKKKIKDSEIIIPSPPRVWEQEKMNIVYGIHKMYCNRDILGPSVKYLNDEQIFSMAMKSVKGKRNPFFSIILNYSTHQPYKFPVDDSFKLKEEKLPEAYRNYLVACHYTDRCLNKYIDFLKQEGVYDNSLIIIMADHHAHLDAIKMDSCLTKELPLFIIHGNIDKSKAWKNTMNQLDVYTTILDILDIHNDWHGLGHTILNSNYRNSLTDKAWTMSEWIIKGKYFGILNTSKEDN